MNEDKEMAVAATTVSSSMSTVESCDRQNGADDVKQVEQAWQIQCKNVQFSG